MNFFNSIVVVGVPLIVLYHHHPHNRSFLPINWFHPELDSLCQTQSQRLPSETGMASKLLGSTDMHCEKILGDLGGGGGVEAPAFQGKCSWYRLYIKNILQMRQIKLLFELLSVAFLPIWVPKVCIRLGDDGLNMHRPSSVPHPLRILP